jgi:hypothetical protein
MTKSRLTSVPVTVHKPSGGSYRSHRNKALTPAASQIKKGPTAGPLTPAPPSSGALGVKPSLTIGGRSFAEDLDPYDFDDASQIAEAHRERGAAISRMTPEQQTSILGSKSVEVVAQLAEHTTVDAILDGLADHGDAEVRAAVRARTEWDKERLARIDVADAKERAVVAARRAALYPLPPEPQPVPALHPELDRYVLTAIREAEDPYTPPWQLATLAQHDHDFVIEAVIANPNTPIVALEPLAAGYPVAARRAAERADCSQELLSQLSKSEFPAVRTAVAGNVRTPAIALRELAKDGDRDVRDALAGNASTPRTVLKVLADGEGTQAATLAHRRLMRVN